MPLSRDATRWKDACRRAVGRQKQLLAVDGAGARRAEYTTVGAGGDVTLALDRDFEAIAIEELRAASPAARIVSEEVGEIPATGEGARDIIVLDPIDGSTNVANGLPQFSLSVAIAAGPSMADVWFGYVYDFGTGEEFVCERGDGIALELNGLPVGHTKGPASLLGFESAEPELIAAALQSPSAAGIKEIRVAGSIAIALCYVALGRLDGLVTCKQCRSVDAAAGFLIATATGADVRFDGGPAEGAGLALSELYRVVAGRGELIDRLVELQRAIPLVAR